MITLYTLFQAVWVVFGIWMIGKFINMVRYQWKYGGNAGEMYLKGKLKTYIGSDEYYKDKWSLEKGE